MTFTNDLVTSENDGSRTTNHMARRPSVLTPTTPRSRFSKRQGGTVGSVSELKVKGDGFNEVFYTVSAILGPNSDTFDLLVDTGSSDLWVASTDCGSCQDAPALWDPDHSSTATASTATFEETYLRGAVSGPVYWEQVTVGGYTIARQAMAAAESVSSEKLELGFSGILGLALPSSSRISDVLPQSDSTRNGNTFTENLFGLDEGPANHFFTISLSRPGFEDRARSNNSWPGRLGIGEHIDEIVAAGGFSQDEFQATIGWTSMVSSLQGFRHWQTRLSAITVWKDGVSQDVQLGRSVADGGVFPIAVFDTGGPNMLASRSLCDAIYGSWDISADSQGVYYVPCRTALNMTITIGQTTVPIHPIDMSYYQNNDPTSGVCQGSLQSTDSLTSVADIVLGVSFLRNVYTVYSYDGDSDSTIDDPTFRFGVVPLTDISLALTEFQNIRLKGMGPDGEPYSGRTQIDDHAREQSMGVAGKIVLGIGLFIALCVALFGARWLVLRQRFKRRNMNMSEEGVPMREWDRKDPSNVSEFGIVGGIEGDLASRHGTIKRLPSAKRQASGPWAGFSLLTFIGARRLGFGGGYERTPNPGADIRRSHTQHLPTEDQRRQQLFEDYQRRKNERPGNRRNEDSVWSDTTWVDAGNGTLAPKGGLATPNETVVGSTTNLNSYGFPKGMSMDDMVGGHQYGEFGEKDSSDGSTERGGSTLHGSVHESPSRNQFGVASTSMGRRPRSSSGNRRTPSQERVALLDSSSSPEPTHRPHPSIDTNLPLADSSPPEPPGVQTITLTAPFPHRPRHMLAVEPDLSPLTEVNSSEFLSSPLASNASANLNAVAAANRVSLSSLANSLPSIGDVAGGGNGSDERSSLERRTSIGALSAESEVLVPLPISIRPPPSSQPPTSFYRPSPLATTIIADAIPTATPATPPAVPPKSQPPVGIPAPPPKLPSTPPASQPPVVIPARATTQPRPVQPSRSRNPFDMLGFDDLRGGGDSRFPTFPAPGDTPRQTRHSTAVDDSHTPRGRPAALPRVQSETSVPRPSSVAIPTAEPAKPRSGSGGNGGMQVHASSAIPAAQPSKPRSSSGGDADLSPMQSPETDFGPSHDSSREHHSLPSLHSDRPRMTGPRTSDHSSPSLGARSRGPRPMIRPPPSGRSSSSSIGSATMAESPRPIAGASPHATNVPSRHGTNYDSPVSFDPYSAVASPPPPPNLHVAPAHSSEGSLPPGAMAPSPGAHGDDAATGGGAGSATPATAANWRDDAARTAGVAGIGARSRFTGDSLHFDASHTKHDQ